MASGICGTTASPKASTIRLAADVPLRLPSARRVRASQAEIPSSTVCDGQCRRSSQAMVPQDRRQRPRPGPFVRRPVGHRAVHHRIHRRRFPAVVGRAPAVHAAVAFGRVGRVSGARDIPAWRLLWPRSWLRRSPRPPRSASVFRGVARFIRSGYVDPAPPPAPSFIPSEAIGVGSGRLRNRSERPESFIAFRAPDSPSSRMPPCRDCDTGVGKLFGIAADEPGALADMVGADIRSTHHAWPASVAERFQLVEQPVGAASSQIRAHMGTFPARGYIPAFRQSFPLFQIHGPSPFPDPRAFPPHVSNSHTVAARGGCTRIPHSAGEGSGGRDHSVLRLLRPRANQVAHPDPAGLIRSRRTSLP